MAGELSVLLQVLIDPCMDTEPFRSISWMRRLAYRIRSGEGLVPLSDSLLVAPTYVRLGRTPADLFLETQRKKEWLHRRIPLQLPVLPLRYCFSPHLESDEHLLFFLRLPFNATLLLLFFPVCCLTSASALAFFLFC